MNTATSKGKRTDDAPAHTPDILTDKQVDYAISQMVERAQNGPYTGMVALVNHFAALAPGRAEAKRDADKLIAALAKDRAGKNQSRAAFEKERRAQFLKDMKMDTGSTE